MTAQLTMNFGGRTYDADLDAQRLGAQLTRVIQAMSDGRWRTLSEIQARILAMHAKRDPKPKTKPVEHFPLAFDPLTGWEIEPAPTYRQVIPVYDAMTGELKEFLP